MALLDILTFPDSRLRMQAQAVTQFDAGLKKLSKDMLYTMYQSQGIGLAATQVNIHRRLLVADVSAEQNTPIVLINPVISARHGTIESEEGCLSVPAIRASVTRAETIVVKTVNTEGEALTLNAEGLLAICIQHEIDHLDGRLFVDYLSPLKRQWIQKKLHQQRRRRLARETTS